MMRASSLEISSEALVRVFLALLPEFAGDSEVYECESYGAITFDASADIF